MEKVNSEHRRNLSLVVNEMDLMFANKCDIHGWMNLVYKVKEIFMTIVCDVKT